MPENEFLFSVKLQLNGLKHYQNEVFHQYFSEIWTKNSEHLFNALPNSVAMIKTFILPFHCQLSHK